MALFPGPLRQKVRISGTYRTIRTFRVRKLNSKTFSIEYVTFECFVKKILSRVLSMFSAQGGGEKMSKSGANLARWNKLGHFLQKYYLRDGTDGANWDHLLSVP